MNINKKVKLKKILLVLSLIIVALNIFSFFGVNIAHDRVFSRADFTEYDTKHYYTYSEINTVKYKREELLITSGNNMLSGFLYGCENTLGLIIISPGHRDFSDIKLSEIMYFVDNGWQVLCYDYTGCYGSEGDSMVGYIQSAIDLEAVLDYVKNNSQFAKMPILLFGHSLGAYASCAVLQNKHNITAVVAASGFDDPMEQWCYSIERFTGVFGNILSPYAKLTMKIRFGGMAHFSAIDGINSVDLPILIMQGTSDEFYGNISSIYNHKDRITNKNCIVRLMSEDNHNGHYDYFLSDKAVAYRKTLENSSTSENVVIDKFQYMEHDNKIMDYINQFYLNSINKTS